MSTQIGSGNGKQEQTPLPEPIKFPTIIDLFGGMDNQLDNLLLGGAFLANGEAIVNPNGKQFESTVSYLNEPYLELFDSAGVSLGNYTVTGSYAGGAGFVTTLDKRFYTKQEIIDCMVAIQAATAATVAPLYTLPDGVTPINFDDFFIVTAEMDLKNPYGTVKVFNKTVNQYFVHKLDDRQSGEWLANGWASVDAGGGRNSTPCGGLLFKGIAFGECDGGPLTLKWCEKQEPLEEIDPCMVPTGLKAENDVYSGDAGVPVVFDLTGNDQAGSQGIISVGIFDADASATAGVDVYATSGFVNIYDLDGLTILGQLDAANPTTFTSNSAGTAAFKYQISDGINKSEATVTVNFKVPELFLTLDVLASDPNNITINGDVLVDGVPAVAGELTELTFSIQGETVTVPWGDSAALAAAAWANIGMTLPNGLPWTAANVSWSDSSFTIDQGSRNDPDANMGIPNVALIGDYTVTATAIGPYSVSNTDTGIIPESYFIDVLRTIFTIFVTPQGQTTIGTLEGNFTFLSGLYQGVTPMPVYGSGSRVTISDFATNDFETFQTTTVWNAASYAINFDSSQYVLSSAQYRNNISQTTTARLNGFNSTLSASLTNFELYLNGALYLDNAWPDTVAMGATASIFYPDEADLVDGFNVFRYQFEYLGSVIFNEDGYYKAPR